jgi:heterodisulfide reductase subunit C
MRPTEAGSGRATPGRPISRAFAPWPRPSRWPSSGQQVATLIWPVCDTGASGGEPLRIAISRAVVQGQFVHEVETLSGQNILQCYQCGECSAGCPVSAEMDVMPNHLIRLVQLGQEAEVMAAQSPWVCASCFTCYVRCPKGVDIARIMEAVRLRHLREQASGDYMVLKDMLREDLERLPPIALVASLRKYTQ